MASGGTKIATRQRILIIDDERDMQVYLRTLFTRAGYDVAVATDGEDGLRIVKSFEPHLVTLDILMPHRSGIEAYRGIRSAAPHTPIIVVTGLSDHTQLLRQLGPMAGPEAIVDKPIDREFLLRRVEELLGA